MASYGYLSSGDVVDVVAPTGGVVKNEPAVIGDLVGVAASTAAAGAAAALKRGGAFQGHKVSQGLKAAGQAVSAGEPALLCRDTNELHGPGSGLGDLVAGIWLEDGAEAATDTPVLLFPEAGSPVRWARFGFHGAGKAVGTYDVGPDIPSDAAIVHGFYVVTETFASATDAATLAIGVPTDGAAGLVAAKAISATGDVWDAGSPVQMLPDFADLTAAVVLTDRRRIRITVGVEALTAGKLKGWCAYAF